MQDHSDQDNSNNTNLMEFENLNNPISTLLQEFSTDPIAEKILSDEERKQITEELFEFVPIEDEEEEGDVNDDVQNNFIAQENQIGENNLNEYFGSTTHLHPIQSHSDLYNHLSLPPHSDLQQQYTINKSPHEIKFYHPSPFENDYNHINENNNQFEEDIINQDQIDDEINRNIDNQNSPKNQSVNLQENEEVEEAGDIIVMQSSGSIGTVSERSAPMKKKRIYKKRLNDQQKALEAPQKKVSFVDILRKKELVLHKKQQVRQLRTKVRIPTYVTYPHESHLLIGDVMIEMNFQSIDGQFSQNCIQNLYKPVQKVGYNKATRCLSIFQASNSDFLIDFSFLTKQLINYPDQNVHLVGMLLEKYQDMAKLLHLQIRNVRSMSCFTSELLQQRRAYFDEQMNVFLSKIDEHQMFFVQKFKTNYETAGFEVYEIGYSRQFLALLGTDEETFTSVVLRNGKPELYNFESRLKMMLLRMLSIVQGRFKGASSDFEIQTFDGIKVLSKVKILPICIDYPPHLQLPIDSYKEISVMALGLIEVEPNIIQQIISIRKQNKYHSHLKQMVQEQSYTDQSQMFLEKYYDITKAAYVKDRENLNQRKMISSENERILSNHRLPALLEKESQASISLSLPELENIPQSPLQSQQQQPFISNSNGYMPTFQLGKNRSMITLQKQVSSESEIEEDIVKSHHFDYIDDSYISQDVHLEKNLDGCISLEHSQPLHEGSFLQLALECDSKQRQKSIAPSPDKSVFSLAPTDSSKKSEIIANFDNPNKQTLDSIKFEFNFKS